MAVMETQLLCLCFLFSWQHGHDDTMMHSARNIPPQCDKLQLCKHLSLILNAQLKIMQWNTNLPSSNAVVSSYILNSGLWHALISSPAPPSVQFLIVNTLEVLFMLSGSSSSQAASVTWVTDSTGLVRVSSTWLSWEREKQQNQWENIQHGKKWT